MIVELLSHTPLEVCANAIRTCWQSYDKSDSSDGECGPKDLDLIDRIGNKMKHASTLEHIVFTFKIRDISRACLQELARHRMASPSVKSTRYTLGELKAEKPFTWIEGGLALRQRADKYIVLTGDNDVDVASIKALEELRSILADGKRNDIAKYCLPESYKTELSWTINARSLQNFLSLRTTPHALWEIRILANTMYEALPENYKFLFKDCIYVGA